MSLLAFASLLQLPKAGGTHGLPASMLKNQYYRYDVGLGDATLPLRYFCTCTQPAQSWKDFLHNPKELGKGLYAIYWNYYRGGASAVSKLILDYRLHVNPETPLMDALGLKAITDMVQIIPGVDLHQQVKTKFEYNEGVIAEWWTHPVPEIYFYALGAPVADIYTSAQIEMERFPKSPLLWSMFALDCYSDMSAKLSHSRKGKAFFSHANLIPYMKRAIALWPGFDTAYFQVAMAYTNDYDLSHKQSDLQEAKTYFREFLRRAKETNHGETALANMARNVMEETLHASA